MPLCSVVNAIMRQDIADRPGEEEGDKLTNKIYNRLFAECGITNVTNVTNYSNIRVC